MSRPGPSLRACHAIKPEYPLPLDPDFYLGRISAAALLASGYRDAKKYLVTRSEDGVPYDSNATRMRDPLPGVAFATCFTGSAVIDGTAGALAVEVRVDIRDFKEFLAGPDRTGDLVGIVDADTLGQSLLARDGSFRLADGHLHYELTFEHRSREFSLTVQAPTRPWGRANATLYEVRRMAVPSSARSTSVTGFAMKSNCSAACTQPALTRFATAPRSLQRPRAS